MAYAFRCKNCNTLETSANAGENDTPAKCGTCGAGVSFSPDGIKTLVPENWEVLADLNAAELKKVLDYHKIEEDEIEAHTPAPVSDPDHVPTNVEATAEEGVGSEDNPS